MSEDNPLKRALNKSKSYLTGRKTGPSKVQPNANEDEDSETPVVYASYNRRLRVIPGSEIRDKPMDLGENGWGDQNWGNAKQEHEQGQQRKGPKGKFASPSLENNTSNSDPISRWQERTPTPKHTPTPKQGAVRNSSSAGKKSGGSPMQYYRPLPFRSANYQESISSPSRRMPGQESSQLSSPSRQPGTQHERVSAPYDSKDNLLRTRVAGPKANVDLGRSGRYSRQGVKLSSGDRERESYQASQASDMMGEDAKQGKKSESCPLSGGRYGDGVKKATGATLF